MPSTIFREMLGNSSLAVASNSPVMTRAAPDGMPIVTSPAGEVALLVSSASVS